MPNKNKESLRLKNECKQEIARDLDPFMDSKTIRMVLITFDKITSKYRFEKNMDKPKRT